MGRLFRCLRILFTALSLLLCVGACVLWVRGRGGVDEAEWRYDRWLSDGSAAADRITLSSGRRRIWLEVRNGQVGPFNGNLVYGYYINADRSGGRPRFRVRHQPHEPAPMPMFAWDPDSGTTGWGPVRWQSHSTSSPPPPGERSHMFRIGIAHWLAAVAFLIAPGMWVNRQYQARRARRLGLCPGCGYDLRATPNRCPECGHVRKPLI